MNTPVRKLTFAVCVVLLFAGFAGANSLTTPVTRQESLATPPSISTLEFSRNPTAEEIYRARIFEEPLCPIGKQPTPEDNAALAAALRGYSKRKGPDDFSALTGFLKSYPQSSWNAALLTGLGIEYFNTAHYSLALDAWRQAWVLAKDATDAKGKAIADRAGGELAAMYARLGRMIDLEPLLKSVENREFLGAATERVAGARQGLWNMQNRPEISFRCGPLALQRIQASTNPTGRLPMEILNSKSTRQGFSLQQVAKLSQEIGMNYVMAFREKGADFVVPSVVHWKVGHYAAMVREEGGRYLMQDPTFGNEVWASRAALEAETSGYFLVPAGALPEGWRTVKNEEGAGVWGKGNVGGKDSRGTGPCEGSSNGSGPCGGGACGSPSATASGASPGQQRMATCSVQLMLVNLHLQDAPVGYAPPIGPQVQFTVYYNHREAFQPGNFSYSNFGSKWTCAWISYITDNPQSLSADVNYYIRGGGTRTFTGFNPATQSFAYQQYDQTVLKRTGSASYEMLFQDGSKLVFSQSDGSAGSSRKVFLTQVIDPFGNIVALSYDGNLRLFAITDAIGQATTITYGLTNDIYKITKVTDPFGRFATFAYDNTNRLAKITDVIGITSQFNYEGSGDFINALITPYGTNSFTRSDSGTTSSLETLFPDGSRERVEFNQTITNIPMNDPAASIPSGMSTYNDYLIYRNTYYWTRTACATGYGDYTKAKIYHWQHTADLASASGILESTKEPLENRVWYDYPGQSSPLIVGTSNRPLHAGRVLDDGSTQLYTYAYDGFGHVTNMVDPLGRTMSYVYSTNGIDLLEIHQTRAGKNELLSRMAYNAQHLPLTRVDAAGQTNTYNFNSRGRMISSSNPRKETTTYGYDTNGYLLTVDGSLPGTNDVAAFSYDAFGRVRTRTDMSGYTLTFDHDALDHITRVTHPDSTYEQFTYDRLDPVVLQDRAGRQTLMEYNNVRQLTKRTDPLGRSTRFQWCTCGDLSSLTDPLGRTTFWNKDVQGRLSSKKYGDGSQVSYFYENTTSRVRQVVDEKNQIMQYAYNRDDTIRSIAYANSTVSTPGVSYTYDPDYRRLASATDGTGTTRYVYNPITDPPSLGSGLLASEDGPLPNDTISYEYDELGRRAATAINGVASRLSYDAAGRMIAATNALGAFAYSYDGASDRVVLEAAPNGQTVAYGYEDILHDKGLRQVTSQVGATRIAEFIYGRDIQASRITTWSQQVGTQAPLIHAFSYDAVNQLVSDAVTNSGVLANTFGYAYDGAGNRLTERLPTATNTATYNALNQISTTTSTGNARTNEWDGEDRLAAVNSGNLRTEFTYNGQGRLASLRQLTNGVEASHRQFVWCDNELREERDGAGAVTKRFFPQGVKIETGTNAGSYYYTRDHLGSVRELTDSGGVARASYSYDPFGRRTRLSGNVEADFGFTGLFSASEASLCLARFRAYDPELGRWLSRDPLAKAELNEGPNLYTYGGNNSINVTDPLGLCCEGAQKNLEETMNGCRKYNAEFDKCRKAAGSLLAHSPLNPAAIFPICHDTMNAYGPLGSCEIGIIWLSYFLEDFIHCLQQPCENPCPSSSPSRPPLDMSRPILPEVHGYGSSLES